MIEFSPKEYEYIKNLTQVDFECYLTEKGVFFVQPHKKNYQTFKNTTNRSQWEKYSKNNAPRGDAYDFVDKLISMGVLFLEFEMNGSKYYRLDKDALYESFKASDFYDRVFRPIMMHYTGGDFGEIE